MRSFLSGVVVICCALFSGLRADAGTRTLEAVKDRGFVVCGIGEALIGFSAPDALGNWTGLDADFCRAVSSAVFGEPDKVKFRPLSANAWLAALKQSEVDLVSRSTPWTLSLEAHQGVRMAGITFFDGQGLMVRRDLGVLSALELSGIKICANTGGTSAQSIADFFKSRSMPFELIELAREDEMLKAYEERRCDAYSGDLSTLSVIRLRLTDPEEHVILPEALSKEPLGPVVRQGDDQWFLIVQWTLFAMITAEELGVTRDNIDTLVFSGSPMVRKIAGIEGNLGGGLTLDRRWAYNIVKLVGNYGEVFDRTVGAKSPLGLRRGFNDLWRNGGLIYAPPFR